MFINIIFKHNLSNNPPGIEINYYALLVEALLPLNPSCSRMISFCPVNYPLQTSSFLFQPLSRLSDYPCP